MPQHNHIYKKYNHRAPPLRKHRLRIDTRILSTASLRREETPGKCSPSDLITKLSQTQGWDGCGDPEEATSEPTNVHFLPFHELLMKAPASRPRSQRNHFAWRGWEGHCLVVFNIFPTENFKTGIYIDQEQGRSKSRINAEKAWTLSCPLLKAL